MKRTPRSELAKRADDHQGAERAAGTDRAGHLLLRTLLASADSAEPTMAGIAGAYTAETLTTQTGGMLTDHLAQGSRMELLLRADGTCAGLLWMPDQAGSRQPFNVNLAGRWTLHGDTVEFDNRVNTFVREMPFVFENGRLEGEQIFGDAVTRLVLEKRPSPSD
jgi:hypothetical protein